MPSRYKLDNTDRRLLRALQQNGRMTNIDLAKSVNLSPSPCLRRLRNLEQEKVIRGYSIDVDQDVYGLPITVFVRVTLEAHTGETVAQFETAVRDIPEVMECHMLTGAADYFLRVVCANLQDYERFVRQRLHRIGCIRSIDTSFVYSTVKKTSVFPKTNL